MSGLPWVLPVKIGAQNAASGSYSFAHSAVGADTKHGSAAGSYHYSDRTSSQGAAVGSMHFAGSAAGLGASGYGKLPWPLPFVLGNAPGAINNGYSFGRHRYAGTATGQGGKSGRLSGWFNVTSHAAGGTPALVNVINKLNAGQNTTIQVIGDSTAYGLHDAANLSGWVGRFAMLLGTRYNATVKLSGWSDTAQAYGSPVTLATGTGPSTITVMNGAYPNENMNYYADSVRAPKLLNVASDVVILADGWNEPWSPDDFVRSVLQYHGYIEGLYPGTPLLVTTQNPGTLLLQTQFVPGGFPHLQMVQGLMAGMVGQPGIQVLDTWVPFQPGGVLDTSLLFDTIHPNATGYAAQAQYMYDELVPNFGAGSGAYAFAGSDVVGQTPSVASPDVGLGGGSYTFSGSAHGATTKRGACDAAWEFNASASGVAPVVASANGDCLGSYAFAHSAGGSAIEKGAAVGGYGWVSEATGGNRDSGIAGGSYAYTHSCAGSVTKRSTASAHYSWQGSANGWTIARDGAAAGAYTRSSHAVGASSAQLHETTNRRYSIPPRDRTFHIPAAR